MLIELETITTKRMKLNELQGYISYTGHASGHQLHLPGSKQPFQRRAFAVFQMLS
jgi:hypothetical protein